ncbi:MULTISPECIES: site-specific DNA-methyltransferase [unclassified Lysobacter]|uniref:site-specific DNA-methyltransferase n=1 Tax=unclassified Lysobacter TaxID=2635362 RepID=UPI001BE835A0|nr:MULTISPECIES: site-specific DNA-methyltransferase [unclassified Lysobacter]MBT2746188.1 site-specific DNA-methyltransferase [Lysobacter sp. ISL-42]MBT2750733.1 site-specific DNA-methyltransferase [Lysobacter sp. ISL-50]MBT2776120.1 site-specific DNA-methyltransferase [Lysobacter sp. ISL-54]MBT2784626.1 site-specific DNA-methyltransferase [Lysobacter sp. ISL-52]
MSLQIEQRPIEALIPFARNARTHSDAQVAQIAASIVEFGWTNPVLVDGASGIIAGHGRLLAARQLGLGKVPVIELSHLTPAQKRAYVIADNRLAENAGWDEELLRLELAELRDADFDLDLLGFTDDELDELLDGDQAGLTDDDEVPEVQEQPVSRRGDVWVCGSHKVLCGDATQADDYAALLGDELADMTFTDPPYNVDYANNPKDKLRGKHRPILNDNLGGDFGVFLEACCTQMVALTKGAIYIAMSSSELDRLQSAFRAAGGRWSTFIIWAKNKFTMGHADYQRQYEPILYGWREGTERFWCGARDQGDVWFIDRSSKNDLHPTMKPVALVERAIRNSSKSRDLVLDPFGGSGTTLIAAEKTGRRARLIELDPKYADVIVRRWQDHTGQFALRQSDGMPFDDAASSADPNAVAEVE